MKTIFALVRFDEDMNIYPVRISEDLEKLRELMKAEFAIEYAKLIENESDEYKEMVKEYSILDSNFAYLNDCDCTSWSWEIVRTENM